MMREIYLDAIRQTRKVSIFKREGARDVEWNVSVSQMSFVDSKSGSGVIAKRNSRYKVLMKFLMKRKCILRIEML